jgi:hypothetical protein
MHKRGKLWSLWLVPAMLALVVGTAGFMLVGHEPSDDPKPLELGIEELRSQAAETRLIALHAQQDDLTRTFVREHARQLEKKMRASLAGAVDAGTKAHRPEETDKARNLAEASLTSLRQIAEKPDDAATLRAAAATTNRTTADLSRLLVTLRQAR